MTLTTEQIEAIRAEAVEAKLESHFVVHGAATMVALCDLAAEGLASRENLRGAAEALQAARSQLVSLGGEVVEVDGKIVSDAIHAAVLWVIDNALATLEAK